MTSIAKNWPTVCRDLNTLTMCPPIIVVLASGRMIAGFFIKRAEKGAGFIDEKRLVENKSSTFLTPANLHQDSRV
jgi:hypothetical protein